MRNRNLTADKAPITESGKLFHIYTTPTAKEYFLRS